MNSLIFALFTRKILKNTLNMICIILWMYATDSEVVHEPNSENCIDLAYIALPCDKVLFVSDKMLCHICNKKFNVGDAKSLVLTYN